MAGLAGLLGSALAWADPPLFTPDEQAWIRAHPVVRFAIDPYWPMEYLENGQLKGITRDYLEHITKVSGLRFQLVTTRNWQDTLQRIAQGELELSSAVSARLLADDTRAQLLLSDPYLAGSTLIVTRAGDPIMYTPNKLNGKVVAVKGGGGYERYLREHYPDIHLLLINHPSDALEAVAQGRADAAVGLDAVLQPVIRRQYLDTLHISGALADMPVLVKMGVSPNSPLLVSIINKSLGTLTSKDTDRIFERWVSMTDYGAPSWGSILRYYWLESALLVLALVLLIGLARNAKQAQRRAQHSEAQKSSFLAMMSHEIRTPMNAVLSSIELLRRTPLEPRQQELSSLANASAVSLLELLDDVLDVSRLEARRIELESVPTDLTALARGVADIHRLAAEAKGIELRFSCDGLGEAAFMLDPTRLRQVLSNLLSNAVKFTARGEVNLALCFHPQAPGKGLLWITVSDTGIGIAAGDQAKLFTAFTQADNSITRRYGGSGLGLSICKQLVELMQGSIELSSEPGAGTTVAIKLAVETIDSVPQEARAAVPVPEKTPAATAQDARVRVLVVEDHPVNQQTIAMQLESLGYTPCIVGDGLAALQVLEHEAPVAIVLLDCHLPGIDGYEVAQRIRQLETRDGREPLSILAISAAVGEEHYLRCLDSGMDGVLAKPLRLNELANLLELWVPLGESSNASSPSHNEPTLPETLFVTACLNDLQQLREALDRDDFALVRHHVHRLHGAALTVGAVELAGLGKELETAMDAEGLSKKQWRKALKQMDSALQRYTPAAT